MKYTVQYIPLNKIHVSNPAQKFTKPIRSLKKVLLDCTHLLAVRKDKYEDKYTVVSGYARYEYLCKTNHTYVPCLIDQTEEKEAANDKKNKQTYSITRFITRLRNCRLLRLFPDAKVEQMEPTSLTIFRHFLKQEPQFKQLSRIQQIKVLYLGIRYRKTVIRSMREKVNEFIR